MPQIEFVGPACRQAGLLICRICRIIQGMHAFLISGGSPEERQAEINEKLEEWNASPFDQVMLTTEEPSIGVSEVRTFQQRLQLTPLNSPYTAGIIQNAHLLTIEAQNALLKTLEEPPPHAQIILETPSAQTLLPTILSRCQLIALGTSDQYTTDDLLLCFKTLEQLEKASVGERVKLIDTIATDRETTKAWVEKATATSRQELLHLIHTGCGIASPPKDFMQLVQMARLLRRLLTAQRQLAANVTPKLALDTVFLHI